MTELELNRKVAALEHKLLETYLEERREREAIFKKIDEVFVQYRELKQEMSEMEQRHQDERKLLRKELEPLHQEMREWADDRARMLDDLAAYNEEDDDEWDDEDEEFECQTGEEVGDE